MRDFIAKISLTALFVLAIFSASAAEKVTFEANSPLTVAVGEPFRVEFALNAQPEPGSFKAPSFEGFDVIAGPAEAQGQSIQIVNNSMTRVINYTITYVLVPQGAGNVTVGAAEVTVEGTTYRTKPLAIEVVDEGKAPGGGGSAAGGQPQRREEASSESAAQSRGAAAAPGAYGRFGRCAGQRAGAGRQGRHPVAGHRVADFGFQRRAAARDLQTLRAGSDSGV